MRKHTTLGTHFNTLESFSTNSSTHLNIHVFVSLVFIFLRIRETISMLIKMNASSFCWEHTCYIIHYAPKIFLQGCFLLTFGLITFHHVCTILSIKFHWLCSFPSKIITFLGNLCMFYLSSCIRFPKFLSWTQNIRIFLVLKYMFLINWYYNI